MPKRNEQRRKEQIKRVRILYDIHIPPNCMCLNIDSFCKQGLLTLCFVLLEMNYLHFFWSSLVSDPDFNSLREELKLLIRMNANYQRR